MTREQIQKLNKAAPSIAEMGMDIQTNAALFIGEELTKDVLSVKENGRKKKIAPTKWYKQFIRTIMDDAMNDPGGKCGQMLSQVMFTQDILDRLGASAQKTRKDQIDFAIYQIRSTLYKEQQEVYDNDIDRKIIVICSRRAGKTELNARLIIKKCLTPNTPVLYLNKTFANSISQMYDLVMNVAGNLEFQITSSSKVDGLIKFSNGSTVKFGGVNDIAAIDKYRGFKYKLIIVDEIGHIKNSQYLIDEVLTPATADYEDSQMIFTGTPPRIKNYATALWHSNIRKYHWNANVNPFIPDFDKFIERVCEEKGLDIEDPFIQREYFGNMDAYDTNAIVFKGYKTYTGKVSDFNPSRAYIGIDWGFVDHNAIVTSLYDPVRKKAVVVDVWTAGNVGAEKLKAQVTKKWVEAGDMLREYGYDIGSVKVVCDTNEPAIAKDLYDAGIPIEKAYKADMINDVEDLGAKLRTGKVLVNGEWTEDGNELIADLNRTVYKRNADTDELMAEIDDDSYHPNAVHALRYAMRNAFGVTEKPATLIKDNGRMIDKLMNPPSGGVRTVQHID